MRKSLEHRLEVRCATEFLENVRLGCLGQLVILAVYLTAALSLGLELSFVAWAAAGGLLLLNVARGLLVRHWRKRFDEKDLLIVSRRVFVLFASTLVCWGLLLGFGVEAHHFGVGVSLAIFFMAGLAASTAAATVAVPALGAPAVFSFLVVGGAFLCYRLPWREGWILFALVVAFAVYYASVCWNQGQTLRKVFRLTEELDLEKRDLDAALDAFEGPVSILTPERCYSYVNRFVKNLLPSESLVGKPVGTMMPKSELVSFVNEFFDRGLKTASREMSVELGGRSALYWVRAFQLMSGSVMIVSIDISDRAKNEERRRQELMDAQLRLRLISLAQMAGGIAHEINNPLAIASAQLEMLLSKMEPGVPAEDPGKMRKRIDSAYESVGRAAKIVTSLRRLSSRSPMAERGPELCRLRKIFSETAAMFEARMRELGVTFRLEVPEEIVFSVSEGHLAQIATNFLSNALDAIESASVPPEGRRVEWIYREEGGALAIDFLNNGPEIPASILQQIFDPFFTTKAPGRGTGLGLPLTRNIIEDSGGTLKVASSPARTVFTIECPRVRPENG